MFGWLLGEGGTRRIALTFVLASLAMLIVILLAFRSTASQLNALYDGGGTIAAMLGGSQCHHRTSRPRN